MALQVGDTFESFETFEEAIASLEKSQNITYYRRDSRTIKGSKRRIDYDINPALKYYEVKYTCIKGGKKYTGKSKGIRPNQRTFRDGCESFVRALSSHCGQKLVITDINLDHNHESSPESFKHLPKQRKVDKSDSAEVENMLKTRPNKKMLQDHIVKKSGKVVTLRDITNMKANMKPKPSNLDEILYGLQSSTDKTIRIITDSENMLQAIYYQDNVMQELFELYPEVLLVDATYKLNDLRMPVFLQLVVDGNGESEVITVFIVVTEDGATMESLIDIFKENNPAWERTKTILTDKDFLERSVYGKGFPGAQLQLCLFHVLKSLKREIHVEKMGLRLEQKNLCLEIIQKIAYSKNEEEYDTNLGKLRETNIKPVISYYMHSWHGIRQEWVIGLKPSCNFGNNTTNRVESINQKLKQVIEKFSNLQVFFNDLEIMLQCLRRERDNKLANIVLKRPTHQFQEQSLEVKFSRLVTPYAYQLVITQYLARDKVKISNSSISNIVTISSSSGDIQVTPIHCTCHFAHMNLLPCRHIFALRESLQMDCYFEDAVSSRWLLKQYKEHRNSLTSTVTNLDVGVTVRPSQSTLSQSQKYRKAFDISQKLATMASEVSTTKFQSRLDVLKTLSKLWESGRDGIVVSNIDEDEEELGSDDSEADNDGVQVSSTPTQPEIEVQSIGTDMAQDQVINSESMDTESLIIENDANQTASGIETDTATHLIDVQSRQLSLVKLPPRIKQKGRPKGSGQTVIGIAKRREKGGVNKPIKFSKKSPQEKDRVILQWFVEKHTVETALLGNTVLTEDDVKDIREIPSVCLDENVETQRVRQYFSKKGWTRVLEVIEAVTEIGWLCIICRQDLNGGQIGCDGCCQWFHFHCVCLPKAKTWFCSGCYSNV